MKLKIDYQKIDELVKNNPHVIQAILGLIHNWIDTVTPIYYMGIKLQDSIKFVNNPNALVPYEIDLPVLMIFYTDGRIETVTVYLNETNNPVEGGYAPQNDGLEGLNRQFDFIMVITNLRICSFESG